MIPPKREARLRSESTPRTHTQTGEHTDKDTDTKTSSSHAPWVGDTSTATGCVTSACAGFSGSSLKPISRDFYDVPCLELCKQLLGKLLVRRLPDGETLVARIVEVEAYPGPSDQASHSFGGKRTSRNRAMFMDPGYAYVYFIYGMYYCFNVSSKEPGSCVLLRAAEPLQGLDVMRRNRESKNSPKKSGQKPSEKAVKSRGKCGNSLGAKPAGSPPKKLADKHLCDGPSKLCQALGITKQGHDQLDMTVPDADLFIAEFEQFATGSRESVMKDLRTQAEESSGESQPIFQKQETSCVLDPKNQAEDISDVIITTLAELDPTSPNSHDKLMSCEDLTPKTCAFRGEQLISKCHAVAEITECPRIGIDGAGEPSVSKLYRFYVESSHCVSVKFNPLKWSK